jgi:alpha-aminoadipate carrier protein LysW
MSRMVKTKCPDCLAEIEVSDDIMVGEILSCPDCGLELEVVNVEGDSVELQKLAIEKEDWGE